jgi:hypothetical protein
MSSGLRFSEVYEPDKTSDTIEMMWGTGKMDVAHYAAGQPAPRPPAGDLLQLFVGYDQHHLPDPGGRDGTAG